MRQSCIILLSLCVFALFPSWARLDPETCGTHHERTKEELFLHRQALRKQVRAPFGRRNQPQSDVSTTRDEGQIALIEDSDGVVGHRNDFDLDQKTLRFIPTQPLAAAYRFEQNDAGYDSAAADAGTHVDLGDDDTKAVTLPFDFPYFGTTYQQIYVNSDGNLTFIAGDGSSADRSLGRLTAGIPRIAPLFSDLDPSISAGGVSVTPEAGRFVVSWVRVPVYTSSGLGTPQTFQARLYPDGRIEFAWAGVTIVEAVVGIAPGRLQGGSTVLSFAAGSTQEFAAAVAERFSGSDAVDIVTAAQKFYQTHDDAYDYLVIFNAEGIGAAPGAIAYEVTARNQRTGYGDDIVDFGQDFGSQRRLQSVLNMGPLSQYPLDPNAVVPGRVLSRDTPLTVLGHEAGHLFLAFASVKDPNNPTAEPMLGRQLAHWSFLFNSEASLLEGNRIQDNGPDASPRFLTTATVQGYAPLDQYLMGLRAPEEVSPVFLVTNSPTISSGSRSPEAGVSFNGKRRDIAVQDIIDVVGRRTPDYTVAQRRFRFGFILVVPAGRTPAAQDTAQLETYRGLFETAYRQYVSDRASADATLKRAVHFSAFPAAALLSGGTIIATLTLDRPAGAALDLVLRSESGLAVLPSMVTIPQGETQVSFPISGLAAGVDSITAEPADGKYETAFAKIQIAADPGALQLAVISSQNPVAVRLFDVNQLPYCNVTARAMPSGDGTVDHSEVVTDSSGIARFEWTPASATDQLTISVDGGPTVTVSR